MRERSLVSWGVGEAGGISSGWVLRIWKVREGNEDSTSWEKAIGEERKSWSVCLVENIQ